MVWRCGLNLSSLRQSQCWSGDDLIWINPVPLINTWKSFCKRCHGVISPKRSNTLPPFTSVAVVIRILFVILENFSTQNQQLVFCEMATECCESGNELSLFKVSVWVIKVGQSIWWIPSLALLRWLEQETGHHSPVSSPILCLFTGCTLLSAPFSPPLFSRFLRSRSWRGASSQLSLPDCKRPRKGLFVSRVLVVVKIYMLDTWDVRSARGSPFNSYWNFSNTLSGCFLRVNWKLLGVMYVGLVQFEFRKVSDTVLVNGDCRLRRQFRNLRRKHRCSGSLTCHWSARGSPFQINC